MPAISFSTEDKKAITRRQVRIEIENEAFSLAIAGFSGQLDNLLKVDGSNEKFHDAYKVQATSYQDEVKAMNGTISDDYSVGAIDPFVSGDLTESARTPGSALARFFQSTSAFFIPEIIDAVNGLINPTGTEARYEDNILDNTIDEDGLKDTIDQFRLGSSGTVSTSLTLAYTAGDSMIEVATNTGFVVGELIILEDAGDSALLLVTGPPTVAGLNFDVPTSPIVEAASPVGVGGGVDTFSGFTNGERTTLTSALYQDVIDALSTDIDTLVAEWETKVDDQIAALGTQNDDRATQLAENVTASSANSSAKTDIDAWQALASTGASGRFVDTNLAPGSTLYDLIGTRTSRIAGRVSEIVIAVGSVSSSGNDFSGTDGDTYLERYSDSSSRDRS